MIVINKIIEKLKDKKIRLVLITVAVLLLMVICVVFIVRCGKKHDGGSDGQTVTGTTAVNYLEGYYDPFIDQVQHSFSYENDKQCVIPAEGVKTDGFVNTTPTEIKSADDVYTLAEKECAMEFDEKYIYYDSTVPMWKVIFCDSKLKENVMTVYINSDGTTALTYIG